MQSQREHLQSLTGASVTRCRQHWLRFSWRNTWGAQEAAGLAEDMTLMFNDRPGLRTAAALRWTPWDPLRGRAHGLRALPTLLMDSHVYDYHPLDASERLAAFRHWLQEVTAVGGEAALLWHPHTLTEDYGWADGFRELLRTMQESGLCAS
jgi:hypothetical protein